MIPWQPPRQPGRPLGVHLAAHPIKAAVYTYTGAELDLPHLATVQVYRPAVELFSEATLASFAGVPVTMAHPPDWHSDGLPDEAIGGYVGGSGIRDDDFVRATLVITSRRTLLGIANGHTELSCGYRCDYTWAPGEAPDGTRYQVLQTNIRIEHVAIGKGGRGGPQCSILQRVEVRR